MANHPLGAVEGLILINLLLSIRSDVRIMANGLLCRIPELADHLIPVDPFSRDGGLQGNIVPLRESIRWVEQGGMLVVFPAGEVSHLHLSRCEVSDPDWSMHLAKIARRTQAPITPVFFAGRNGVAFHAAGFLHPRMRTALLARQLLNKTGLRCQVRVGGAIPWRQLANQGSDEKVLEYVRMRTYLLGKTQGEKVVAASGKSNALEPIIAPVSTVLIERELTTLSSDAFLLRSGEIDVLLADASRIPHTLLEIGRLRELSFRQANEGTGKSLDLDRFDNHYRHLFLWHRSRKELIGAYRLGETDRFTASPEGIGLYSSTLFNYRNAFLKELGTALELGRSFIRPEYQRGYTPLLLLWQGIGHFVAQNPRYRILFGPVSISASYSDLSRTLIAGGDAEVSRTTQAATVRSSSQSALT